MSNKSTWAAQLAMVGILAGCNGRPVQITGASGKPVPVNVATQKEVQDFLIPILEQTIASVTELKKTPGVEFPVNRVPNMGDFGFFDHARAAKLAIERDGYLVGLEQIQEAEKFLPKATNGSDSLQERIRTQITEPLSRLKPVLEVLAAAEREYTLFKQAKAVQSPESSR